MSDSHMSTVPTNLSSALTALITKAKINAEASSEFDHAARQEVEDAGVVVKGLSSIGITVEPRVAFEVWSMISLNSQAGWLDGPRNAEGARIEVLGLCQHIADGTDYAGFSGME